MQRLIRKRPSWWMLATAACLLVMLSGIALLVASQRRQQPNVLVISVCSIRPDHMSLYGYPRETTPNLEQLAQDAILFDHAVTQWPKTAPAFAALMTGKYGHTTGVTRVTSHNYLGDEHQTLASILRENGYATAAFISTPALRVGTNILRGFDTVIETFDDRKPYIEAASQTIRWLSQPRSKPFLAWVHFNNAHYPYTDDTTGPDMFVDDEHYDSSRRVRLNLQGPLRLDVAEDHPNLSQLIRNDIGGVHPKVVLDERPREYDFYIARYDAGIYGADHLAGRVLEALRKSDAWDNTIVVLVGDHGESLGEHDYYFEHGRFAYEDCARVPLLIRPAGGGKAQRISAPVAAFDMTPTVLDLIGIRPPPEMEAESLLPVARGESSPRPVFTEAGYHLEYSIAMYEGKWKLIHVPHPLDRLLMTGSEYELYDLSADPSEERNLYDDEVEVAAHMRRHLDGWFRPRAELAYVWPVRRGAPIDAKTLEKLRSLGYME